MIDKVKNFVTDRKVKISERRVAEKVSATGLDDFVRYLRSPWRILWSNFLAGIFRGLGFVIGATVVLAISVYVLVQVLGNLPWVGEFFQWVGGFVKDVQEGAATLKSIGR
ncbi:MAG: DUF5665 domain-containing protein [Candidatus Peribacteraceae bacterium]|nr:DUF5665 domain-containing protein [Candidatus Peribacteraceae bacterium]